MNAYGTLSRNQMFSFVRNFLPTKSHDDTAYGIMFEMMIYSLSTWDAPHVMAAVMDQIIAEECRLNGESYWLHNALGGQAFNADKTDVNAYLQYALGAAKLRSFAETYHISSGMDAIRPLTFRPSQFASRISSSGFHVVSKPPFQPEFVHLVSADPVYFERYTRRLLDGSKAYRSERNITLHCHVSSPSDATLKLADELREEFPWFCTSFDVPNFPDGIRQRSRMAYYAAARFVFEKRNRWRCHAG
jgi:hypothetical protein